MQVTIYHNPNCGTSRNTLAMIRNAGIEPAVVEYLQHPLGRDELRRLIADAELTVRDALRTKGTLYVELGLDKPELSDEVLLDAMIANPALINRPFVVTPLGTKLCRPSELVLEILPAPQQGVSGKEDAEPVMDASGKQIKKDV